MNKKLVVILSCTLFAAACGNSGETKSSAKDSATTAAPAAIAGEKGLELIGGSDCTTCHRLQEAGSGSTIGPAYSKVADKYAPAADTTVDRLVKKIISGGSGIWGAVPMTPHPSLKEADVKEMVSYIMTLKK
ncbi:MAG TPA: c-type cytochrome [Puia sp.]|nr:c-type cytochrome [Puia sp.]